MGIAAGVVLAVVLLSLLWPGGNRRVTAITLLSYLLIILVVPVAEELFFRGLLLSHLKETMGAAASIAIITLLFGLVHVHQGLLFEMALRLGVNEVRFIPLRLIGAGKHLNTLASDHHASFRHLLDVLNRNPRYRDLLKWDFFTIVMNTCLYKANRSNCGIGSKTVFIDADGKVYPCPNHVLNDYLCSDIHTKSLTDIVIRSSVMERIRGAYHVNKYSECNRCAYIYWCSGDCRGEVLSLTGNPNGVSPHCNELKRLYTEMLWSIAEGSALSKRNSETGENYTYPFRF